MKIRVKKHIPIPHVIGTTDKDRLEFAPELEVEDERAKALLASWPNVYEISDGKTNKDDYQVKDTFKNALIQDIVGKLNPNQQLEVFEHAKALALGKKFKVEAPKLTDGLTEEQAENVTALVEAYKDAHPLLVVNPSDIEIQTAYNGLKKKDQKAVADLIKELSEEKS